MTRQYGQQVVGNVVQGGAIVIGNDAQVSVEATEIGSIEAGLIETLLAALRREATDDADRAAVEAATEAAAQRKRNALLAAVSSFSSALLATNVGAALAELVKKL
jgi:hypothetical protein